MNTMPRPGGSVAPAAPVIGVIHVGGPSPLSRLRLLLASVPPLGVGLAVVVVLTVTAAAIAATRQPATRPAAKPAAAVPAEKPVEAPVKEPATEPEPGRKPLHPTVVKRALPDYMDEEDVCKWVPMRMSSGRIELVPWTSADADLVTDPYMLQEILGQSAQPAPPPESMTSPPGGAPTAPSPSSAGSGLPLDTTMPPGDTGAATAP